MNRIHLTGFSTALFSTWYFLEQIGVLFDCGDGCSAGLLQKGGRVRHIFVSHADRDHLSGLLQFLQLNGNSKLTVYYPRDCGSFPALQEFCAKFDPQTASAVWRPLQDGQEVDVGRGFFVRAFRNEHVRAEADKCKSLSFSLYFTKRKLKPEYADTEGTQLAALRQELGQDAVTFEQRQTRLIYSGDTPIKFDGRYAEAETLIHEATFLNTDELSPPDSNRHNLHSSLEQVMEMAASINVRQLLLGHFSSRYSREAIQERAMELKAKFEVDSEISLVLPGDTIRTVI